MEEVERLSVDEVALQTDGNGRVELTLGPGITIVGDRVDVHSVIIEADRQLARLVGRWTGQ